MSNAIIIKARVPAAIAAVARSPSSVCRCQFRPDAARRTAPGASARQAEARAAGAVCFGRDLGPGRDPAGHAGSRHR